MVLELTSAVVVHLWILTFGGELEKIMRRKDLRRAEMIYYPGGSGKVMLAEGLSTWRMDESLQGWKMGRNLAWEVKGIVAAEV